MPIFQSSRNHAGQVPLNSILVAQAHMRFIHISKLRCLQTSYFTICVTMIGKKRVLFVLNGCDFYQKAE